MADQSLAGTIDGYKQAVIFTESHVAGETEDNGIREDSEFSAEADRKIRADCKAAIAFMDKTFPGVLEESDYAMLGHDLWLTRNGHGAGFWDGDWREDIGNAMTEFSHKIGESNAWAGDGDGLIYLD